MSILCGFLALTWTNSFSCFKFFLVSPEKEWGGARLTKF